MGRDRPESLKMAYLDPSTANLQRSSAGRHSHPNEGAHKKKSHNLNKTRYPKMGILAEWNLHPTKILASSHDTTHQQQKRHLEAHMALKSLAKNNLLSLANLAP
jgi:hypothetical protein